jgi:F420-dependent oxidoreductase-like protein
MKLGLVLPYEGGLSFPEILELTLKAEALGFDSVWVPEAWGTDSISILGALAARTNRIRLGTGIVNVFSRTPALLAQTAATLDLISNGRFILGLGTSGHQVITGWHGVPFDQPLQRMRQATELVRRVLRREPIQLDAGATPQARPLKLLVKPLRANIPIFLATLTPAGTRLTAEVADGWIPTLFSPEYMDVFRPDLEAGAKVSGRSLDSLEVAPAMPVCVDESLERARAALRPWVALYVGGMGSRAKNFYNQTVSRYGFAEDAAAIQELYLGGKKLEAIQRIPDALVDSVTIAGPGPRIKERLKACDQAGVTLLMATVYAADQAGRLHTLEVLSAQAA